MGCKLLQRRCWLSSLPPLLMLTFDVMLAYGGVHDAATDP